MLGEATSLKSLPIKCSVEAYKLVQIMELREEFNEDIFYGYLIRGNLQEGISYLSRFKEQTARSEQYKCLFEKQNFIQYPIDSKLKAILDLYQLYYRDVFYLGIAQQAAEKALYDRLASSFALSESAANLASLEEAEIAALFAKHNLHFMGGRTGGFYGPYVWRHTEQRSYAVELPEGVQSYSLYLHKDFICKSWLDYISFGKVSTGGWADKDGNIHCIADCYNEDSEEFQVSLLKHEAQHTTDLSMFPNMSQESLEYRAKLVELIYSQERNLLLSFATQTGAENGHALAATRIVEEFAGISDITDIRARASMLFSKSLG